MTLPPPAIRDLLARARADLVDTPPQWLGERMTPRRVLLVARAPRVQPRGRAWHLGVLLLTDDARLLATGQVIRASDPGPRGFAAESARTRAEWAAAAVRGGFREGQTVHVGWSEIDLDALERGEASGPIVFAGGAPAVRWSSAGASVPLAAYLAERVELLRHPPEGA